MRWSVAVHPLKPQGSVDPFCTLWAPYLRDRRVLRASEGRRVGCMVFTHEKNEQGRSARVFTMRQQAHFFKGTRDVNRT
jgi:hypothetical protein